MGMPTIINNRNSSGWPEALEQNAQMVIQEDPGDGLDNLLTDAAARIRDGKDILLEELISLMREVDSFWKIRESE